VFIVSVLVNAWLRNVVLIVIVIKCGVRMTLMAKKMAFAECLDANGANSGGSHIRRNKEDMIVSGRVVQCRETWQ